MKNIWIVNYYSPPLEYTSNPRHLEFAHHLTEAGYDATIFDASFLRDKKIDLVPCNKKYLEKQYGEYKFVHIKVKHYNGNGIDRMLSIFQFAFRLYKYRRHFAKPDIILHNIHAPFDYPVYWCAKKLKATYIAEAWDLWPDGFVRFSLISPKNPLVPIAYAVERKMYENADRIIFSFAGGIDYLKERKWDKDNGGKIDLSKVDYINNGVNIREFEKNRKKYILDDQDLRDPTTFKIIYLGSVRLANNLKRLIDAAALLKQYPKFRFLIYGDGSDREYLKKYCKENNITNVIFKQKNIPFQYVPYVVSQSNLNIINYEKNFGIYGISSGKFFMYLAAGKPILCNVKISYCEIEKHNLGIAKDLDTTEEYADAILKLGNLNIDDYSAMCHRVKETAQEYDYKILSGKLLSVINNVMNKCFYPSFGKRLFELVLTVPALMILSPVLVVLAFFVRLKLGSPILFKQIRLGLNEQPFNILKFRTMTDARDHAGDLLPDAERLTRFGRFLRAASLDELPELINVIKGDMSLVGPRPLLMQYMERYTPEQARRHEMRPGITGWAQVNGRNAISWEEKFKYDVWYLDNWSVALDIKIIAMTIKKVFLREGISQEGQATMEEFNPQITQITRMKNYDN